eukprot:TRINITY_DN1811_c0_g1_i2.p1 TRINITY_DN1811_c0_g1~~TRINITY_DN1811_c0_g1_i2.p1  ORF type:complete len:220 (-),score=34.94 TRINITY_DN1811_c0_g1_i2:628-1242(-)
MSLSAQHPGHIIQMGEGDEPILIELFMDITCPFSGREMAVIEQVMQANPSIRFTVHQIVQPWHVQSTLCHEALFALRLLSENARDPKFLRGMFDLFAAQPKFTDIEVWDKSRKEIHEMLLDIVEGAGFKRDDVANLLAINQEKVAQGMKNPGSYCTPDLKFATKYHRKRGVHESPTVFVNGIEAKNVSSSWTLEQWNDFIVTIK